MFPGLSLAGKETENKRCTPDCTTFKPSDSKLGVMLRVPRTLLIAGVVLTSAAVQADDTEVFFGNLDPTMQIKPNVLFALDTSGSMNWGTDDAPGGTEKRITRLKSALRGILQGATNLNVGMMRFNGAEGGGAILYPVTDIDQEICVDDGCGEVTDLQRISSGDDDLEENVTTGDIALDGIDLTLGEGQLIGLRFDELPIPSGATITSARLEFTSYNDLDVPAGYEIAIEDTGHAEPFTAANADLSARTWVAGTQGWSPDGWVANATYESPEIKDLLQQIVNRADWCGGNAAAFQISGIGARSAMSTNHDANQAPALKVTYNTSSVGAGQGCMTKTIVSQVRQKADDAEQRVSNGSTRIYSTDLELNRDRGRDQLVGIRFQDIAIPKNATINSAYIEFEADQQRFGNTTLDIAGEASDDANRYYSSDWNISSRSRTSARVAWVNPPTVARNQKIRTPDLSPLVQEIVNRGGWNANNSLAFVIERTSGSGFRELESFDGEPSNAPTLVVEYVSTGLNLITVRDILIEEVDNLKVTGGTPILDVLYEAGEYFTGQPVDYGKTRGNQYTSYSYNPDQRHSYHRVSHPESVAPANVSTVSGCDGWGDDAWACRTQKLQANPVYKSPMVSDCQSNHIVLLSDGQPTWQSAHDKAKARAGISSCEHSGSTACITDFTRWLAETDHATGIPEEQTITTYTIGFGKPDDLQFLRDVAEAGHGEFFGAVTAEELEAAFNRILSDVLDIDTTFVAPGATVNQFNRLTHRNDIYFSLFKPKDSPLWGGNLKKYKIKTNGPDDVDIVDRFDRPAVDIDTGFFSTGATSLWSDIQDGTDVEAGGAAGELSLENAQTGGPRKIYTYTGSPNVNNVELTLTAHTFHEDNDDITKEMLGIPTEDDAYRDALIQWARGVDIFDENSDGSNTDIRLHMGDPMHSRPLIVNYNGAGGTSSIIYVATNEGFLHAIDHVEGKERFAFIPQELLANLDDFYQANPLTPHPYGLDGDISSWIDDTNGNTMVDPGEKAYLFFGMRRGGSSYYALDISNPASPKLKWIIRGGPGGTDGYSELAQTWTKAAVTGIRHNNVDNKPVLIFGGGYDVTQDASDALPTQPRRVDTKGRALYIADLETGAKIWSASSQAGVGADLIMSEMLYSIPGNTRVIDIDFDGNADQMYVADMGGQIWRFDINSTDPAAPLVKGGVLASLSGTDAVDARRFYYEPDVSLISKDGKKFLSIAIGSGWRAHPLDNVIQDRMYMIRVNDIYSAPEGYGKFTGVGTSGTWSPITESDLLDVTDEITPAAADIFAHSGWMIDLEETGEKILSEATTINNQLIFTSYLPSGDAGPCQPAAGSGNVYVLNVFDGSPTLGLSGSTGENGYTKEDRKRDLKHGGIPPAAAALISEEGVPIVLVGPEQPLPDLKFGALTNKTWWQEVSIDE